MSNTSEERKEMFLRVIEMYLAGSTPKIIRKKLEVDLNDYECAIQYGKGHGLLPQRLRSASGGDYKSRQIAKWPDMPADAFQDDPRATRYGMRAA